MQELKAETPEGVSYKYYKCTKCGNEIVNMKQSHEVAELKAKLNGREQTKRASREPAYVTSLPDTVREEHEYMDLKDISVQQDWRDIETRDIDHYDEFGLAVHWSSKLYIDINQNAHREELVDKLRVKAKDMARSPGAALVFVDESSLKFSGGLIEQSSWVFRGSARYTLFGNAQFYRRR